MGKRGPKPKTIIDTKWRPELAYAVGLLASDGSLSSDGRHIELTSKDVDLLNTFKHILNIEHIQIGSKVGGCTGSVSYRVEFGSVLFYEWLRSIGLTPRKSHTIGSLAIPDALFADFIRGIFDGDGSIYSYWDTRWRNSYMYYIDLCSASPVFLLWLQETSERLYGIRGVCKQEYGRGVQILRFAKREATILLEHMYADARAPFLARKFTKIQKVRMMGVGHKK